MGRPLKKWPSYALNELEDTLFKLNQMEKDARRVQVAIADGDTDAALIALSDVRVGSRECVENLVRARTGNYNREKQPAAWTAPQEPRQTDKQRLTAKR